MAEATQDVNRRTPSSQGAPDSSTGTPPSEASSQAQSIPYDRFKEVNDKAKTYEQQLKQFRDRDQQWQARSTALERQLQYAMQQQYDRQRPQESGPPKSDPVEQLIRENLGNDEAGNKAYDTLERHFEHKFSKVRDGLATKQEIQQAKAEIEQSIKAELNATFQTSNRFTEWVQKGMITPQQSQSLQAKLNDDFQRYPDLVKRPRDVKARVAELLVEAMESDEIKPFSSPRPRNPVSVNGAGAPNNEPPKIDPSKSMFNRLRSMKSEDAERLQRISLARHHGANS